MVDGLFSAFQFCISFCWCPVSFLQSKDNGTLHPTLKISHRNRRDAPCGCPQKDNGDGKQIAALKLRSLVGADIIRPYGIVCLTYCVGSRCGG